MMQDNYSKSLAKVALGCIVINTDNTTTSVIIDTAGFESGKFVLFTGVITAGDVTITKIQESDDSGMSGATDIPTARLIGTAGTAITVAETTHELGFVADTKMRYVQATFTTANSANSLCIWGNNSGVFLNLFN